MNFKNLELEIHEKIFTGELNDIIEVTYAYRNLNNGFFYNVTLFENFGGFKYKKSKFNFKKLKDEVTHKLDNYISLIDYYIPLLSEKEHNDKSKILFGSLLYIKNILSLTLEGLDFELEKAGYNTGISSIIAKNKILKIGDYEKECFGEKIKDNKNEMRIVYSFLFKKYNENKHHLSGDERVDFLNYIKLASRYLDEKFDSDKHKFIENEFIPKEYYFYNSSITRENYIKLFNFILKNIYNLPQKAKITEVGSIYDGDELLEIPKNEKYEEIRFDRFLSLISHEVESHYINLKNSKCFLGSFRGARNLEKEEGLAKSMEYFLVGYNLKNIKTNPEYFPKILFSEILEGTELYNFINIYSKIHNINKTVGDEFLRQKRNYSFNQIGGQHKDIAYGRGMIKVIDYLKKGNDFSSLFLAKVGFKDISKINKIVIKSRKTPLYPLFIGEIIRSFCISKEQHKEFVFNETDFAEYIYKKYPYKGIKKFSLKTRYKKKKKDILRLLSLVNEIV